MIEDLGRVVAATAQFLPVGDVQRIKIDDTDIAVRERVFGQDFLAATHLTGAPHVTVTFYNHHGQSFKISVIRIYKSLDTSETRGVEAEFGWQHVTPDALTEKILEFAQLTVEEMNSGRHKGLGGRRVRRGDAQWRWFRVSEVRPG